MPTLYIQLLGNFRLDYNDDPAAIVTQKRVQSLLAYLLLHRDTPQSRQQVAFLFWPDSSEQQARTNLRRELYHLRHLLPDAEQYMRSDAHTLQWRTDAPFMLDVAKFETLTEQAGQADDSAEVQRRLTATIEIYRGPLLPSCYDDWILPIRERLRRRFGWTLEKLILLLEEQRDYPRAIRYAERLLRHDPVHEPTYRRLMRLHALNGDRAGALRVYHTCVTVLQRELGVEPDRETQAAYARLLSVQTPAVLRERVAISLPTASRLVGRQSEWQRLRTSWRTASQGTAHFVLIGGEAGIGKTRLAEELFKSVDTQGIVAARTRSYAAEGALAYAPVVEWLRSEAVRPTLEKLDDPWLTEVARLLPELLIERPDLPQPEPLAGRWQRQRLFEALARAFLVDNQPRLLLIDDLQWCDQETLEWLRYLLRFDAQARLLVVGTVRIEEVDAAHPLTSLTIELRASEQLTEIELGPLDADETTALAEQELDQKLETAASTQLYQETEGNPLFVVETVRASGENWISDIEERIHPSDPHSLPPKVHAVIQHRLAQLSPQAHELANLAATIGRTFSFDVLVRASEDDETTLVRGLDELWQRRIVREQDAQTYDFSHDRIREAAYADSSRAQQRLFHRQVADALKSIHAPELDDISGQIAFHFEQAGLPGRAIPYYQRAGEAAQRLYASQEACTLLRRGLALLAALPESGTRDQQELDLQRALGMSLVAVRGTAHEEVKKLYLRAHRLCRQLGQFPDITILRGLSNVFAIRGQFRQAQELQLELMELARSTQKPDHLVEAHFGRGASYGWMGDFCAARHHLEQAIAYHHPVRSRKPGVTSRIWLALVQWFLGYPDQALRSGQESLDIAHTLTHPSSQAYAWMWYGKLHEIMGNPATTLSYAEKTISLATEYSLPLWSSQGITHRGWALAELGNPEEGIAQICRGMAAHEQTGAQAPRSWHLALLATAYGKLGRFKDALAALDEALTLAEKKGILDCQAERWRLKGELMLQAEGPRPGAEVQNEAEVCFLKSIDIARSQQAKSLELRAVMSLCRLWQSQGRQAEARQMLVAIYDWFSEGFGTPDLQAAQTLLDELKR